MIWIALITTLKGGVSRSHSIKAKQIASNITLTKATDINGNFAETSISVTRK